MRNVTETLRIKDKEYQLRLTTSNIVKLETEEGLGILEILEKSAEIGVLAKCFLYAAKPYSDEISSVDEVYMLFDEYFLNGGSVTDLQLKLVDVYHSSGLFSDEAYNTYKEVYKKQLGEMMEMIKEA